MSTYEQREIACRVAIDRAGLRELFGDLDSDNITKGDVICAANWLLAAAEAYNSTKARNKPRLKATDLFRVLDEKPGYWSYRDEHGREGWHRNLRIIRNDRTNNFFDLIAE